MLGKPFDLGQPGGKTVGQEVSPYGMPLGVTYAAADVATLIKASTAAGEKWGAASIEDRAGVCLEIVSRINKQSFLLANAVMHTTGQGFMMAFQAGGPHAQDRALEAIAYAYDEMKRVPQTANWSKPQGKADPLVLDKNWRIVPRGISLVIGCATFPTWNGYPAIFASLATGNSVIVKPHPGAILPLAITVKIARDVLKEAGFDPNVIMLAPDNADAPVTKDLVTHPDIAIVDFTGSNAFGRWVRENAATDVVFTEEAGINSIVIDSTSDFRGLCNNIAFSLSLYSGQMCTAPQNIFVPAAGIDTNDGKKSFDEVASGIATAIDKLLGDPERAATILGAVQNEATIKRVERRARARPGRARFIGRAGRGLREGAHGVAAGARHRRQERDRLGRGALRPDRLRDQDRIDRRGDCAGVRLGPEERRDHRVGLFHQRAGHRRSRKGLRARRRRVVGQSHRRRLRQPVGGVLRLSRHRRQSGRQCVPDGFRLRRQSFPRCYGQTAKSRLISSKNIQREDCNETSTEDDDGCGRACC